MAHPKEATDQREGYRGVAERTAREAAAGLGSGPGGRLSLSVELEWRRLDLVAGSSPLPGAAGDAAAAVGGVAGGEVGLLEAEWREGGWAAATSVGGAGA